MCQKEVCERCGRDDLPVAHEKGLSLCPGCLKAFRAFMDEGRPLEDPLGDGPVVKTMTEWSDLYGGPRARVSRWFRRRNVPFVRDVRSHIVDARGVLTSVKVYELTRELRDDLRSYLNRLRGHVSNAGRRKGDGMPGNKLFITKSEVKK